MPTLPHIDFQNAIDFSIIFHFRLWYITYWYIMILFALLIWYCHAIFHISYYISISPLYLRADAAGDAFARCR
jgi:hypothetical protein